jgi:hypothetical protein
MNGSAGPEQGVRARTTLEGTFICFLLAAFVVLLTPRGWEPGAESHTAWAAARILAETGGFPVFGRNVLYTTWLVPFLRLPFPFSQNLEYCLTHVFALACLFSLSTASIGTWKSLLLVAVITPVLALIEGGGTVAAIGFFSLYLRTFVTAKPGTWPLMPASLLAAALCHTAYWPFLWLHLLVTAYYAVAGRLRRTTVVIDFGSRAERVASALLVAFTVTALVMQSDRFDHNAMLADPRFAPIPLNGTLNLVFFQIKTWDFVQQNYDPSVWYAKDWFFETPKFFGHSKHVIDVLRGDPGLFFSIVSRHIDTPLALPLYFYSFFPFVGATFAGSALIMPALLIASALILVAPLIGLYRIWRERGAGPVFILVIGVGGIIAALLLTNFNTRYILTPFPVFVLAYTRYLGTTGTGTRTGAKAALYDRRSFKLALFIAGCTISFADAPDITAFTDNTKNVEDCGGREALASFRQKAYRYSCRKVKGAGYQLSAVVRNEGFLRALGKGTSMVSAYDELKGFVDPSTRILSKENTFFAAFTPVDIDNNHQLLSLPPYQDTTAYTKTLLDQIDIFFISDGLATEGYQLSTQSFLRYKLHILPYLTANQPGFEVTTVPRYGKVYVRKTQKQQTARPPVV